MCHYQYAFVFHKKDILGSGDRTSSEKQTKNKASDAQVKALRN